MAQGFFDDSTGVADGSFPTCPAGEYAISGIRWLKSCTDDNGAPIFKSDKRGPVVRVEMIRADGNTPNPVHSVSPENLLLLVKAFGGNVNKLPKNKASTPFMLQAMDEITKSGNQVHVVVGEKGWVKVVKEATIPEGLYRIRFLGARNIDNSEPLRFMKAGQGREKMLFQFEIAGNTFGKSTPYDGIMVEVWVTDPFDGSHNGVPKLFTNESGKKPADVARFEKFVSVFSPETFYHDWEEFELVNPIQTVMNYVKHDVEAVCSYVKSTKGDSCRFDLMTLTCDSDEEPSQKEEEKQPERPTLLYVTGSSFYKDHPKLATLADWMYQQNQELFHTVPVSEVDQLSLSTVGGKWANEHFPPLWLKAGIESGARPLKTLPESDADKLLKVIESEKSDSWS